MKKFLTAVHANRDAVLFVVTVVAALGSADQRRAWRIRHPDCRGAQVTQLTDPARRMPPENCQRCARVRVWITDVTRWHCSRELHMQDKCNDFNPLPNGRRAEPAN